MFNAKSRAGSNYLSIGFHKGGKFKGFLFSFAPTLLLLVDFPETLVGYNQQKYLKINRISPHTIKKKTIKKFGLFLFHNPLTSVSLNKKNAQKQISVAEKKIRIVSPPSQIPLAGLKTEGVDFPYFPPIFHRAERTSQER